jgi:hypothetical protein
MFARFLTVKTLIRAAFTALSLATIGVAHAEAVSTPHYASINNAHAAPAGQGDAYNSL